MNIHENLQRLKKHTYSLLTHNFVEDYLEPPVFDEAKMLITYSLLDELGIDEALTAEYFSSILLIQSALDRHDHILDQDVQSMKKKRQLVVLSGDYFSSLYYLILSRCENLDLIRALSEGVQRINEHKTALHESSEYRTDSVEWLKVIQKVESLLYTKTAQCFGLERYVPFIEDYLLQAKFSQTKNIVQLTHEQKNYLLRSEKNVSDENTIKLPLFTKRSGIESISLDNDLMLGEG